MIDADGRPLSLRWEYDKAEIIADGIVHAVGIALGLAGAITLLVLAAQHVEGAAKFAAVTIYALGIIAVLCTSAAYNLWPVSRTKWWLRRLDHACIYVLIAGTYTPFITQLKNGLVAALLFAGVWATALLGAGLKLTFPGRLDRISIATYVLLGASGVLAYESVTSSLAPTTLWLIVIGGATYVAGVPFHLWTSLRFQNAVWHSFVLVATAVFYSAILGGVVLDAT
jgi:hemolysin III